MDGLGSAMKWPQYVRSQAQLGNEEPTVFVRLYAKIGSVSNCLPRIGTEGVLSHSWRMLA